MIDVVEARLRERLGRIVQAFCTIGLNPDTESSEYQFRACAASLGLLVCDYCPDQPVYEVSWSDRGPIRVCEAHLAYARHCAADDGLSDRTDNPDICELTRSAPGPQQAGPWPRAGSLYELTAEVVRARAKFPGRRFMLAALVEEVGELAVAMIHQDSAQIAKEAIQVACTAIRIREEGDATTYRDGFADLVGHLGSVAQVFLQKRGWLRHFAAEEHLAWVIKHAQRMMNQGDSTFDDVTAEESQP